jgi:hypothetical protein
MYCLRCHAEYDDDLTECSHCHVPLLTGTHALDAQGRLNSANGLVVVLETNDRIQFAMAKGLLEDAGIPLFVQGQFAALYASIDGFLRKWVRLQVPRDREAEARELLERFQPAPWRVK